MEGKKGDGAHDVLWLRPDGGQMSHEDWESQDGREPLLIVFNAAENGDEFKLPPWANVAGWSRVLDTVANSVRSEEKSEAPGVKLIASPGSIRVFAGKP